MADNSWACPIPEYWNWATYTDYDNIRALLGGRCSCLVSLWSMWNECHDSFGPGSVRIESRDRRVLVPAENGGECYPLEQYRPCRVAPESYFNGSIPVIKTCVSADADNFGTELDLSVYARGVEIESFRLNHTKGNLSCWRQNDWSFTNFGCSLCGPWRRMIYVISIVFVVFVVLIGDTNQIVTHYNLSSVFPYSITVLLKGGGILWINEDD